MSFKDTEIGSIPEEWGVVSLGEVAEVLSGYAFKRLDFIDDGIPVIKIKNIVPPYITLNDAGYVSEEMYDEKIKFALEYDDILISMTGSNVNQFSSAVGKVGRVKIKNTKLLLNQRVGKITVYDKTKFDETFLYYLISTDDTRWRLASAAGGSANQANISPKQIKALKLPCPDILEQKLISKLLTSLDDKIDINIQICYNLEKMAQLIFKYWFVDFEFPNENGEPYKSSCGKMNKSELGVIPEGWGLRVFGDFADIISKSIKPYENPETMYEHYSIPALDDEYFPCFEHGNEIKSNKYKVYEDSVLISKLNPRNKRIWYPSNLTENAICSTEFINYVPKDKDLRNFVYSVVDSTMFIDFMIQHATGSTNSRQRVKPKDTLDFKVVLPTDDSLMKRFDKNIESIYQKIVNKRVENKRLKEIRDALLPKLMSGEIRIDS